MLGSADGPHRRAGTALPTDPRWRYVPRPIGLGIVVGGLGPQNWMVPSLIAGAAVGVVVMAVGGATKVIFAGLGSPPVWHWVVLGSAFVVEGFLVYLVSDRTEFGSRAFWMWMLIVVAAHFAILTFSHGPFCAVLTVLCLVNAAIGLHATSWASACSGRSTAH